MKVALVHDYIKEYGGAERVLEELHKIYPDAPIYTAFYKKDSKAYKKFEGAKIIPAWVHYVPFFADKLHSPLRFLAPLIWGSFDFSEYDVVITSASWYITKGFGSGGKTANGEKRKPIEVCYCHTPPRWLYGYNTSIEWQRFWPVKLYGIITGHFMRLYDFTAAQKVDYFVANSEEVKKRIEKFYRRDATVIYPPVSLPKIQEPRSKNQKKDYYFVVSRIVGGKGLDMAVEAANKLGIKLKIAGTPSGYYTGYKNLTKQAQKNIEFLGHVTDEELVDLYSGAKAFFALAEDEDFGMTPVESMMCGTPVIAYYGGGYKESVVDGKTGVFFKEYNVDSLASAIEKFEKLKISSEACRKQAEKFSAKVFDKKIREFINSKIKS
ncbi:MAG TPA: glycosyltransferase [Patescibacteria group bacterium]|nr:glycosyltransferase [Patescibacteria group bacterium]